MASTARRDCYEYAGAGGPTDQRAFPVSNHQVQVPPAPTRTVKHVTCTSPGGPHIVMCHIWGDRPRPVALCVHGLSRNARDFDALARHLAADYRVVCVDLPGHGGSEQLKSAADHCEQNYAGILRQVKERLGLGSVTWIGSALGGLVGMRFAAAYPDGVDALVLNGVGAEMQGAELQRLYGIAGMSPKVNLWPLYRGINTPTLVIRAADSTLLARQTCRAMAQCGPRARIIEAPGGEAVNLGGNPILTEIGVFLHGVRVRSASHARRPPPPSGQFLL